MFRNILVPLDGSRLAEAVLAPVSVLARAMAARVTLLHVLEARPPASIHGDRHLGHLEEATEYLEALSRGEALAGLEVAVHVHEVREGDPVRSIASHADEFSADLVSLCVHGRTGVRDFLRGTNAERVLALGRRKVLFVPSRGRGEKEVFAARRILVPLDADPAHEPGALIATDLARRLGAAVHLVMVVREARDLSGKDRAAARFLPGAARALLDAEEGLGGDYLARWLARLGESGVTATVEVARGDPARAILAAARRVEADMLVLGSHGRGALEGFFSGSVTPRLAWRIRRPMLIVPV